MDIRQYAVIRNNDHGNRHNTKEQDTDGRDKRSAHERSMRTHGDNPFISMF